MRNVCVFCGSQAGAPLFIDAGRQFGIELARRGWGLVFGGGHIGLMGVIADAVMSAGGQVLGVIPKFLEAKELAHRGVTQLHVVDSMHARKALMAELADAFVALPGGIGTADELFEIMTWRQLRLHAKPIALWNVAGFFDPLTVWLDHMVATGFLQPWRQDLLCVEANLVTLFDRLALD